MTSLLTFGWAKTELQRTKVKMLHNPNSKGRIVIHTIRPHTNHSTEARRGSNSVAYLGHGPQSQARRGGVGVCWGNTPSASADRDWEGLNEAIDPSVVN